MNKDILERALLTFIETWLSTWLIDTSFDKKTILVVTATALSVAVNYLKGVLNNGNK